ncbi:MAG: hypothetical protein HYS17_05040 [Micavibrio aeruginosavorus]|uniref:Uncharacterized protein n=1 Tax=Micavibrio aeruginosavorus TaxID=349221 RepID=A0A7T5UHB6_9BACT|nr:MAG: hypothetical protein HYS17_05040 [Micavibrio aeruginosavorus]
MTEKAKKKAPKAKFYNPPNTLRAKAGYGGMDPAVIERAEDFIRKNEVDFTSYALSILERLDRALDVARIQENRTRELVGRVTGPIMELKANGAMFKFSLLSDVADIALDFLENLEGFNDDAYEIVNIHRKTLYIIISNQLRGTGGKQGKLLISELHEACQRYNKRYGREAK